MAKPISSEGMYRCFLVLEVLRSTGLREFPMQLASMFFYIASHDGCLQQELEEACSQSNSAVSRNVDWLGAMNRRGEPGLGFVRREKDHIDGKRWRVWLTPKGEQFCRLVQHQLKGAPKPDKAHFPNWTDPYEDNQDLG